MKRALTFATFFIHFGFTFSQSMATGIVYHDANENGKKDGKEKGIAKIPVSNGIDVVLTDENGKYQLPISNDNIIFIIKPSGYKTRCNESNLPQFYHIHKPAGSPTNFQYKGVAATDKLPKSIDFGLIVQSEPTDFTTLIFGDPQPYDMKQMEYFEKGIVNEVANIKNVPFGISLGDLVGDNLDLHQPYISVVRKVGIPWYNVMGNHDMNYEAVEDSLSDETFESNFGPANYAFNYANVHFIILDDILYPDPRDKKGYWGGFRKSQLDFIANDLKHVDKSKLVVLAYHIPLQFGNEEFNLQDRQKFFDLLKDYPHVLTLCAHTHLQRNDFYTIEDGWQGTKPLHEYNAGTACGDWFSGEIDSAGVPYSTMRDGTPKGYAFIQFKNNEYAIDYKVASQNPDYKMELFVPKVIPYKKRITSEVYVNFFMGNKNDKVQSRIDKGEWKDMTYADKEDPSYLADLLKWDLSDTLLTGRRGSNAVKCTHLWKRTVPSDLTIGTHTIEIQVTDYFGRVYTEERSFNVIENIKGK